jgi:hypothetical protein
MRAGKPLKSVGKGAMHTGTQPSSIAGYKPMLYVPMQ